MCHTQTPGTILPNMEGNVLRGETPSSPTLSSSFNIVHYRCTRYMAYENVFSGIVVGILPIGLATQPHLILRVTGRNVHV